jgi:hypothetical protein
MGERLQRLLNNEQFVILVAQESGRVVGPVGDVVSYELHTSDPYDLLTHDPRYAAHATRHVYLFDGRVVDNAVELASA